MKSLRNLESELDNIRGRYNWEKSPVAQELMEKIDILKETTDGKYCKIITLKSDDPDELVTYAGTFRQPNRYVKDFKDGKVEYTYDEAEAKKFCDDVEGTRCMRQCIEDGATHILVWTYEDFQLRCQNINYPNEYWRGNLQPLLMHHTVSEYHENNY